MKIAVIILSIVSLGLLVSLFVVHRQVNRFHEEQKEKLETELKQVRFEKDSLFRVAKLFRDSFDIQIEVNRSLAGQISGRDKTISKLNKSLKDVVWVQYHTDSQRDSILRKLYPQFYELP
jgi:uncharacterized protein HemX